ncbi:MAG: ATP-grasp domain-containing protein [Polyangiales bacterium]
MIEATRFYVHHRNGYGLLEPNDVARRGFWELNVETVPFETRDDVDALADLGPTVGVAGDIGDVQRALKRLGRPMPDPIDYPDQIMPFLGRSIWRSTLGAVREGCWREPVFVKSVAHKRLDGLVWKGDDDSRRRVVHVHDDEPVWCSEVRMFVSEYRVFVLDGELLDVRRYRGDWSRAPSRATIEAMVATASVASPRSLPKAMPRAYCIDVGVTDYRGTLLIEANDGYAFGTYGLAPVHCARMLSARWQQLVEGA